MLSIHSPQYAAYPGEYIPKQKIMKALAEGYFESDKISLNPKHSISQTDEYYKIEMTIPGIKRENLLVTTNEKGSLCIMGYKTGKKSTKSHNAPAVKNRMDTFLREIPLPEDADTDFTSASCHEGTLTIFFTRTGRNPRKRASTIVVY
ncbi:MAG: Hsp20/alpha crystallin family protein [Chitinophagaceae bacterium]|nr:Hsp20/alpha crystallin family protein [Chitinophagaceae bacterium]